MVSEIKELSAPLCILQKAQDITSDYIEVYSAYFEINSLLYIFLILPFIFYNQHISMTITLGIITSQTSAVWSPVFYLVVNCHVFSKFP